VPERIKGLEAEADGELFTHPAEDEADARLIAATLGGRVLVRHVFETRWR
jgi:hypothetical protein